MLGRENGAGFGIKAKFHHYAIITNLVKNRQLYTLQTKGHKLTRFQGVSYVCVIENLLSQ
jgi:hypothetical protein